MKSAKIVFPVLIALAMFLTACGNNEEPEGTLDDISNSITKMMDAEMSAAEKIVDKALTSYDIARLNDADFKLPIEYDKTKLSDALVITNTDKSKSDLIVVFHAKDKKDIPELENYAKKLRDTQYKMWENKSKDEFEKVQQNMTKTIGNYVVYVTHDKPQGITDAVEGTTATH